jgi:hypothetical protein
MATKKPAKARTKKRRESVSGKSIFLVTFQYTFDVVVCIDITDAELVTQFRKLQVTDADIAAMQNAAQGGMDGSTDLAKCSILDGHQVILRLREWHESRTNLAILFHELFHAVVGVFQRIGMKLCDGSEEAYAHAIKHLTLEVLRQLSLPPSKRTKLHG